MATAPQPAGAILPGEEGTKSVHPPPHEVFRGTPENLANGTVDAPAQGAFHGVLPHPLPAEPLELPEEVHMAALVDPAPGLRKVLDLREAVGDERHDALRDVWREIAEDAHPSPQGLSSLKEERLEEHRSLAPHATEENEVEGPLTPFEVEAETVDHSDESPGRKRRTREGMEEELHGSSLSPTELLACHPQLLRGVAQTGARLKAAQGSVGVRAGALPATALPADAPCLMALSTQPTTAPEPYHPCVAARRFRMYWSHTCEVSAHCACFALDLAVYRNVHQPNFRVMPYR